MINIIEILSKIGFDWKVALANTINFLIVFFVLSKIIFPSIKKMIEERQKKISEGLNKSEEADLRLKEIDEMGKDRIKTANTEALEIINKAEKKMALANEQFQEKMEKKKMEANNLLRSDFEKQKEAAKQELFNESVDLIKEIVVKTVEIKPDVIDRAMIENAVSKIKKSPQNAKV